MSRSKNWLLYGPFAAFGAFLVIWAFVWRAGAGLMQDSLALFAAAQAPQGVTVSYGPLTTRGFPFYLRGEVANFLIASQRDSYRCEKLFIDALPYAPGRIIFSCGGAQRVVANGRAWSIATQGARASIERDQKREWLAKLDGGPLTLEDRADRIAIAKAVINLAPTQKGADAYQLSARLTGVDAPKADLERLDIALTLAAADPAGVRTLTINGVEAHGEGAIIRGGGSLRIRPGSPAAGRIDAEIENPASLARALAKAGLISPDETQAAEAGFAMLAVASGGTLRAPIDIDGADIRIAGFKLSGVKTAQP